MTEAESEASPVRNVLLGILAMLYWATLCFASAVVWPTFGDWSAICVASVALVFAFVLFRGFVLIEGFVGCLGIATNIAVLVMAVAHLLRQ